MSSARAATPVRVDAHIDPKQIGRKLQDQYDKVGVAFGQEIMAVAEEGQIKAVAYMWPAARLTDAGPQGYLRNQSGRPGVRRRLLSVKHRA